MGTTRRAKIDSGPLGPATEQHRVWTTRRAEINSGPLGTAIEQPLSSDNEEGRDQPRPIRSIYSLTRGGRSESSAPLGQVGLEQCGPSEAKTEQLQGHLQTQKKSRKPDQPRNKRKIRKTINNQENHKKKQRQFKEARSTQEIKDKSEGT